MKDALERLAEMIKVEPPATLDTLVRERALDVFARSAVLAPGGVAQGASRAASLLSGIALPDTNVS